MVVVQCSNCGKDLDRYPNAVRQNNFCNRNCVFAWRRVHFVGSGNPKWQGGERWKKCTYCGQQYTLHGPTQAYSTFKKSKFCSKPCADKGGIRYEGEAHPNWKAETRRKNRREHGSWARAVLTRDKATCQHCGATDVELHAHHIKEFARHPELRWELSNGLTLCYKCHWQLHATGSTANGVNSGNIRPGNAEDNPEPSDDRKVIEGVTTSGRAFRKWVGNCRWCKVLVVKRLSDLAGKDYAFCSKHCSGKWSAYSRSYRQWKNPPVDGSNAATSAPPERDEIV